MRPFVNVFCIITIKLSSTIKNAEILTWFCNEGWISAYFQWWEPSSQVVLVPLSKRGKSWVYCSPLEMPLKWNANKSKLFFPCPMRVSIPVRYFQTEFGLIECMYLCNPSATYNLWHEVNSQAKYQVVWIQSLGEGKF